MRITLNYRTYLVFFILVSAVLLIRIGDINFLDGRYLWAEDGNIFINQALSLGLESILNPHAGYILLYPRLISLLAVQFDLIFLPTIFFMAWLGAVLYSSFVVFQWLYKQTKSMMTSMIIPLLILLQPHSGETFFNITNAQWFLPLALIVLLIDKDYQVSYKNFFVLIILGLTGPFSILVLPVLFLNIVLKKDLKQNYPKYIIIFLTALVQTYFMLESNRAGGIIDPNIFHWLKNMFHFFSFGLSGYFLILSFLIWGIAIFYTLKIFCDACQKKITENQINAILLIFALIIIYFAGVWSTKQSPQVLHPLGGGSRYFVIPYALLIISSPLLIKNKIVLTVFLGLMFITSFLQLNKGGLFNKANLNFQSFAWFSNHVDKINIPIHPQWGRYPGWHIEKNKENKIIGTNYISIDLKKTNIINGKKYEEKIEATNNDLQIVFDFPLACKDSSHIGLEVVLTRDSDGWSQVFYGQKSTSFSEQNSLKRYYLAGNTVMQFAFENNDLEKIRIDPTVKKESIKVDEIKIYCDRK